jgi:hypothetical protein
MYPASCHMFVGDRLAIVKLPVYNFLPHFPGYSLLQLIGNSLITRLQQGTGNKACRGR